MGEFLSPAAQWAGLQEFLERGGNVLLVIMFAAFVLWSLILERYAYWRFTNPGVVRAALGEWTSRDDKSSWYAHAIRNQLIAEVREKAESNMSLLKTVLSIAPLLGLLGTVTGMVEVFTVMAVTGSSNARLMSGGISKATIPTMAGMIVAISGLFFSYDLERRAKRAVQKLSDELEIHHA
jgi:biopolymer transport protein ExbB